MKRQIQNNALRNKSWHDRSAGPSGALRTYRHPVARVTTDDPRHDHCFSHSRTRSKFLNLCDATCDPSLPADSPDVKPDRVKVGKLGNWGATHALHVLTSQLHQMALARSLALCVSLAGRSRLKCRLTEFPKRENYSRPFFSIDLRERGARQCQTDRRRPPSEVTSRFGHS